jgi:glycosyltransferase involved in cell wall biosynthesis
MNRPTVSVCVPAYNQARFLGEALRSVLAQTLQDFEVIVGDDASTDETPEVVTGVRDERVRCVRQTRNVGVAENRNCCLALARGRYIAWLDSDDVYHPRMLETQCGVLDRLPRVGLVHGAFSVIAEDGRRLPDWPMPFHEDRVEEGKTAFRNLIFANYITTATVVVRRECHDRVGPFATDLGGSSTDWEMWLRIALHADLAYTSHPAASYRQHPGSISSAATRSGERLRADVRAVSRIFRGYGSEISDCAELRKRSRAALAVKALMHAGDAFCRGRRTAALSATGLALRLYPPLRRSKHAGQLLVGIACGDEYAHYTHSRALLGMLHDRLAGTLFAARISKIVAPNPDWEGVLLRIAETIREVVPGDALVVVVDKNDPTILHHSRRKGFHFPDLCILPGGYPADSKVAIDHLEQLKARGAGYLVFPCSAFWWLEHYEAFREGLEGTGHRVWKDDRCVIYRLTRG